jgi:hypothetical protein
MNRRAMDRTLRGWIGLVAAVLVIVATWTIVLPTLGSRPALRSSIDRREALGVNANAMFYTELECMETLVVHWRTDNGTVEIGP